ncbi:MAG TPA: ACP phosphodiesterase [Chitinophagaceae bacterium]|nr:ACP phosphodiesterase [Chitinophagaceae bacterium]
MNYLAHAYLSFNEPEILVGNMISDFVKGKKKFDYSLVIQKGIILHRAIDKFTDEHEATKKAKEIFRPEYRLYSGAFVDVVFDHFLALNQDEFTKESLLSFTQNTYHLLTPFVPIFPERFQKMFPYMKSQNWLYNYQFRQGIEKSFGGIVQRASYLSESDKAFALFEKHYSELHRYFNEFFPALKAFAYEKFTFLTTVS